MSALILPEGVEKFVPEPKEGFTGDLKGAKFPILETTTIMSEKGMAWIGMNLENFDAATAMAYLDSQKLAIVSWCNERQNEKIKLAMGKKQKTGIAGLFSR